MKQKELENLIKDIKTEFARKAKFGFVMGITYGLLFLAAIIMFCFLAECDSSEILFLSVIFLVISIKEFLFPLMAKNIMKAENAEELLSRYDAYNNIIGKCFPFIVVLVLLLFGYVIYNMITAIKNENGYGTFWVIVAILVGQRMMDIPVKGNVIGRNDVLIERLRKLVEKEQQDTL
jgi:hypothetical protein